MSNRSYRLLLSASAVSNLGDGVALLALPWLATLITRDPLLIAFVAFATRLPWLLFSIPVGVLIDRGDRRRLMVQADSLRVLLTVGVVVLILSMPTQPVTGGGTIYIAILAAIAFLIGAAEVIRDNAAQTMLPSVVQPGELEHANGQLGSIEQIMGAFIGPPVAGMLIAFAVPAPFTLNALAFALSAWLVWLIVMPPRLASPRLSITAEIGEGWRWLYRHPLLLRFCIMLGVINFVSTMAFTALVLFSQEILRLNAVEHGMLLTAGAAGGVVGGVLGPGWITRLGPLRALYLALVLMIVPFAILAWTSNVALVALALFVDMLGALLWNIVTVSYRQRLIPDALLGRVNALYRFFAWGMMPVGALASGWIIALCEADFGREDALRMPYILAASVSLAMLVYGWRRIRF